MLVDGINLVEGSEVTNLTVATGASLPGTPNDGEMFYLTSGTIGLYIYDSSQSQWNQITTDSGVVSGGSSGLPAFPGVTTVGGSKYMTSSHVTLISGAGNSFSSTALYVYVVPFNVQYACAPIAIMSTIVTVGGGLTTMGIYTCDSNGNPASLIANSPNTANTSTGAYTLNLNGGSPIGTTLQPGWYFIAIQSNASPPIFKASNYFSASPIGNSNWVASGNITATGYYTGYGTLGLPSTIGSVPNSFTTSFTPIIGLKF